LNPILRRAHGLALVLLAVAFAPLAVMAHSHKVKGLEIVHPWTFAASGTGGAARVSMTIKNTSGAPERLLRASSPVAAKVELREAADAGATLSSKPLPAVPIPAGHEVDLTIKGAHVLLTGVKKRLDAHGTFKLTLVFEKAGSVVVDVMVEENEQKAPARP
jgi:periplasmic copper chaperone A